MTITALPALDRTDTSFRTDVDLFFATQLPTFSVEAEAARVEINDNTDTTSAAAITSSTQAVNSANSALLALARATAANSDASAAALSKIAAEAALDAFDDKYLGSKASDPLLDNDGNPLQDGAFYINSVSGQIRAYTIASGWVQSVSATAGVTSINSVSGAVSLKTVGGIPILGSGNIDIIGELFQQSRTSNTTLTVSDTTTLIYATGTWTQLFSAASTLGNGWYCYIKNNSTGLITLDPNGSELIDGLLSYIMYPGELRLIQCNGTSFQSIVINPFLATFTSSGSFIKPPGYTQFGGLLWGGGGGGATDGGGGGGACHPFTFLTSAISSTQSFTIAAASAVGGLGNQSTFSTITSYGGAGATAGDSGGGGGGVLSSGLTGFSPNGGGPDGGNTQVATASSSFGGGQGASNIGALAGDSFYGGGGGCFVGKTYTGVSVYGGGGGGVAGVAAGVSIHGGAGGENGNNGDAPGGGGGSGSTTGARGELRIWGEI